MNALLVAVVLVVVVALVFDYINGFHDTANAIATVVSTGVLPMRTAVLAAAALNFVGAFMGTAVASTLGKGLIAADAVSQAVVLSALLGAIVWNLFTWYFGIPSSSSHALVGGLVGAAVARRGTDAVQVAGLTKVVKALVLSPIAGFAIAFVLMIVIMWIVRRSRPEKVHSAFRKLQLVSAGFMAISHGSNDAQKTMGIVTMSLVAYGFLPATGFSVPLWVIIACATAMALGTASGGARIIRTMGTKIIALQPIHGFAAETASAITILTASHLGLPVSTTHVITGSILGAGASVRVSAVHWGVTTRILWAWVFTIPVSAGVGWACYQAVHRILPG